MATIYDVARMAGVSAKTVSRVLNGDGPVSPATREVVETAMRSLGYSPSRAARAMRGGGSRLVGLITGAISSAASGLPAHGAIAGLPDIHIVQGIQAAMRARGRTLMIADTGGLSSEAPPLIDTFLEHRVEGLIYVADHHQAVNLVVPGSTPLVLANCFDARGTPCVLPDDRRGQRDLTARLIQAGHTRVAYLTLRQAMEATKLRTLGYRDALEAAGLPFDPALVVDCEMSGHPGADGEGQILWDAIDRMLHRPDPPTVLACGNDKMALRLYGLLRSRGMRIPEDVSVAGYDNHRVIAETLFPPLTTVDLPYTAIGARSAARLLALIDGETGTEPAVTLVGGQVQWRASVIERRAANVVRLRNQRED